jgi:hypothetical protein
LTVQVASVDDLSRMKRAAGRPKDLNVLGALQAEDLVVGGVLVGSALLDRALSVSVLHPWSDDPLSALIAVLATVGALVALGTRVAGESRFDMRGGEPARMWMIGPFIGGVGFIGGSAMDRLGLPGGEALVGVAFVAALASILLGDRLPVISRTARRILVTPFVVVAAVLFHSLAAEAIEAFAGADQFLGTLLEPSNLVLTINILFIVAAVGWIFYAMLIFVPRELADPGGSSRAWMVRFVFFYLTLVAAILLGGTVPVLTP